METLHTWWATELYPSKDEDTFGVAGDFEVVRAADAQAAIAALQGQVREYREQIELLQGMLVSYRREVDTLRTQLANTALTATSQEGQSRFGVGQHDSPGHNIPGVTSL